MARLHLWTFFLAAIVAQPAMALPPPSPVGSTRRLPPVSKSVVIPTPRPAASPKSVVTLTPRPAASPVKPSLTQATAKKPADVQIFSSIGNVLPGSAGFVPTTTSGSLSVTLQQLSPGRVLFRAAPAAQALLKPAKPQQPTVSLAQPKTEQEKRLPFPQNAPPRPAAGGVPAIEEGEPSAGLIGQIRDEQGGPVASASVSVGSRKTTTDASGSFLLEGLPIGRWPVQVAHKTYLPQETRVWLAASLKTPIALTLVKPIKRQEATRVGLLGVGSLPGTDTLSQRMAEGLVRTGAFPDLKPLAYISRGETMPVLRKLELPLYEVLDHDRPNAELVKNFFDYLGLTALVVARVDMLTQEDDNDNKLTASSRLLLWQFKDGKLQIRELVSAKRSQDEDKKLSKAEAEQIYEFQVAKMAEEVGQKWQEKSPLDEFTAETTAKRPAQTTDTSVELIPPTRPVDPKK